MGPAVKIPGKHQRLEPPKKEVCCRWSFLFISGRFSDCCICWWVPNGKLQCHDQTNNRIMVTKLLAAQTKSWYFGDPYHFPTTYLQDKIYPPENHRPSTSAKKRLNEHLVPIFLGSHPSLNLGFPTNSRLERQLTCCQELKAKVGFLGEVSLYLRWFVTQLVGFNHGLINSYPSSWTRSSRFICFIFFHDHNLNINQFLGKHHPSCGNLRLGSVPSQKLYVFLHIFLRTIGWVLSWRNKRWQWWSGSSHRILSKSYRKTCGLLVWLQ